MLNVGRTKIMQPDRRGGPGAWRGTPLRERLATLLRDAYQQTPAALADQAPAAGEWTAPTLRPLMTTFRRAGRQLD
jgi:hypothetical protein